MDAAASVLAYRETVFRRMKPYQLVIDAVLAGVFFVVAAPVELAMTASTPSEQMLGDGMALFVGIVVAVLFSAALALARVAPGLSLGVAWAGALLQVGLGRPPSFSDLAIFVVLYATAAHGTPRVYRAGLISALVGALVIAVYLTAGPLYVGGGISLSTLPLALMTLVAAAFALGLSWTIGALVRSAVRTRQTREAQQRAEADAIAEQERVRIARDMHDVVAHSLAVVIAQADGARYAAASDPSAAANALGTISSTARAALADVRLLLTQLRHSQADGPQPTLADLETLYAHVRAAGVTLRVDVDPAPPGTPPASVQLAVYRILQEALTNALRHGAAGGPVDVRLSWLADRVELSVRNPLAAAAEPAGVHSPAAARSRPALGGTDTGQHAAASSAAREVPGHGIIGMRERAQLVGGRLEAGAEDQAFIVSARIPIGGVA
jgi:signal transduction histidine kinase